MQIIIAYEPADDGADDAELLIESDDPETPTATVLLTTSRSRHLAQVRPRVPKKRRPTLCMIRVKPGMMAGGGSAVTELGVAVIVLFWLFATFFGKAPRKEALEIQGRRVEIFEEEHNSDTFVVLRVSDPELPGSLMVEPAYDRSVIKRAVRRLSQHQRLSEQGLDQIKATGDPDFDARVEVSGLADAQCVALFDAESRHAVAELVADGALLRDSQWTLSRQKGKGEVEPFVEPMVSTSKRVAEAWARVVDGCDEVLFQRLISDASAADRRVCLQHLLDAPGDMRPEVIEIARVDTDINIRARIAALDGRAGLPVLIEAAEDGWDASTATRIEALRGLARLADGPTRAALVFRILDRGPAYADTAVLEAALAIDPSISLPPVLLAHWFLPNNSEANKRAALLQWLGRFGDEGRDRIHTVLETETHPMVLRAAADTLARVGTSADISRLEALRPGVLSITGPNRELRQAVDQAIEAIKARRSGDVGSLSLTDHAEGRLSLEATDARLSVIEHEKS